MVSEQTEDGFAPSLHPPSTTVDTSISYPSVNLGLSTDQFREPADVRSDTSSVAAISCLPWDDPTRELKAISGGTFIGGNVNYIVTPPNISIAQAARQTNNCPPPSRIFQGRQTIRDEMNQFFNQDIRKQHIYLLYGLGGAGKTQIMLKFISDSSCFTDKFFLDASTKETINTGLKEIAVAKNAGNSAQDALKWLVNNHGNWLLFFDNADDPKIDLNTFLPKCNHGNIVITSRNPGLCVYAGLHSPVSDMEETDAVALLLKSAAQEPSSANEKIAAEIVKEMCYLPLAIVQAGAFISQSGALDRYLDLYMKNQARLLSEKPRQTHDDYACTVYTTWQMSFNKLSQPAAMFLQLCSFLHRDGISEEIFSRAARYTFPSCGPSKEELEMPVQFLSQFLNPTGQWDSLCFLKVTSEIQAYSLVTFDPARKVFSIHPLVHSWSQTTITIPDQQSYHSIMSAIVGMSIQEIPSTDRQLASLQLISHLDSLMHANQQLATDFGFQCGTIYYYVRRYEEAKDCWLSVSEKQQRVLGNDHPDTLSAMANLASTYKSLVELPKAEELEVVVAEKKKRVLGDDHPDTLLTTRILASTYRRLGEFHKAEELGVVVLEKQKRVLGDDDPNTLYAMISLASTYCKLGEFHKAEELEVVVLEKQKKVLGDDHPDTLFTMGHLASTYHSLCEFHKAEELGVVVLEERKRVLGDDHPDTLSTMSNLALTYRKLGSSTRQKSWEL
ncbi:P-loop containing nucleoside triphosphate hydrolase protein [Mycena leptocephala]|nr:P-loop containing nucleoside triphosphate hydrolase protein [Mycena leptocephala]